MTWYMGTILGCLCLAVKNYMSRTLDMTAINIFLMQIPLFGAGMFYWHGFRLAPKFINCWFLGSGLNAVIGIALGIIFFDKVMNFSTTAGVVFCLTGAYLLVK